MKLFLLFFLFHFSTQNQLVDNLNKSFETVLINFNKAMKALEDPIRNIVADIKIATCLRLTPFVPILPEIKEDPILLAITQLIIDIRRALADWICL